MPRACPRVLPAVALVVVLLGGDDHVSPVACPAGASENPAGASQNPAGASEDTAGGRGHDDAVGTGLRGGLLAGFVANLGQWPLPARYVARLGAVTVRLDERGWWVDLSEGLSSSGDAAPRRGVAVRMTFAGSDLPSLVGEDRLVGVHHYFLGDDPTRWRSDVPRFDAVRYHGLYRGVDLRAYEKDGHFEYDVALAPGADLGRVEVVVEGAEALRIERDGTLVIDTRVGPVRQSPPLTEAIDADGARRVVACAYELRGPDRFGFVAPAWEGECRLLVDPGLVYSTVLGGWGNERARAVSVDAAGVVTCGGETNSPTFPTTPGAWSTIAGGYLDAFVAQFDPSLPGPRQLVYATFVGGRGDDVITALSSDAGVVTAVGHTRSPDFAVTAGAWRTTFGGDLDAFVVRLDPRLPAAQQLVYGSFVGGAAMDAATALAVDAAGVVTLTGYTISADFQTTAGAWDTTHNGGYDAFVVRLDPRLPSAGQLLYATFLGGSSLDSADAMCVDAAGVVTLAGTTYRADFPTTPGAFDTTFGGVQDAFVAQLDPRLPGARQLVYSTFLGGAGEDRAHAVAVDARGALTLAGYTGSADFPTSQGAFDATLDGGGDAFVTRLAPGSPSAQQLVYSTFLGGAAGDLAYAMAVDEAGVVTVAGQASSADFPTTPGAWDARLDGVSDAFVARLNPSLSGARQLLYATLFGGDQLEQVHAMCVDELRVATVVGRTHSVDFPTTPGAWDTTQNGGWDAFVSRVELLPTGVRTYGASSPGCRGRLAIGVTSMPQLGNATFALTCNRTPPSARGVVLLAAQGLATPLRLVGVEVWIDPASAWLLAPTVTSNGVGAAHFALPLPSGPWLANLRLHAQFAWASPVAPAPCPPLGVSTSNALEITIQR